MLMDQLEVVLRIQASSKIGVSGDVRLEETGCHQDLSPVPGDYNFCPSYCAGSQQQQQQQQQPQRPLFPGGSRGAAEPVPARNIFAAFPGSFPSGQSQRPPGMCLVFLL